MTKSSAVQVSSGAVQFIALAISKLAQYEAGAHACASASAPAALVALSSLPSIFASANAAFQIAAALAHIAENCEVGRTACLAASAPAALAALANSPVVKGNAKAAKDVAAALQFFASLKGEHSALAKL